MFPHWDASPARFEVASTQSPGMNGAAVVEGAGVDKVGVATVVELDGNVVGSATGGGVGALHAAINALATSTQPDRARGTTKRENTLRRVPGSPRTVTGGGSAGRLRPGYGDQVTKPASPFVRAPRQPSVVVLPP
jgi:hypothetical protein